MFPVCIITFLRKSKLEKFKNSWCQSTACCIWYKIFKNGPSKIYGRQSLKNFTCSIPEYFASYNAFKKIIDNVTWMVCVKHLMKRDETKLREPITKIGRNIGDRKWVSSEIIKDVYSLRVENLYEYRFVEWMNPDHLKRN